MASKKRLGDVLKARKSVTEGDLVRLIEQGAPGMRLGDLILDRGLVSKEDLVLALEEVVGCRYMDARFTTVEPAALRLLPKTTALRYNALPITRTDRQLVVVMADPQNLRTLDELRFISGLAISPRLGLRTEIQSAIDRCYNDSSYTQAEQAAEKGDSAATPSGGITTNRLMLPFIDQTGSSDIQIFSSNSGDRSKAALDEFAADMRNETTPAVRLASAILAAAVAKKASDIHIEPHDDSTLVRIRVDGFLRELTVVPNSLQQPLVSRLKILASMDIAERRAPQDGRFLVQFGSRKVDLRVSTLPTHDGEKVVMRLLDPSATKVDFTELGFSEGNAKIFRDILAQPQGMILVTGPTGSGKSTTLYSALNVVIHPSLNVITVEDPVEYKVREINQVQINPKAGLTFAGALRAILRQDPNIVMVGEIRDSETAEIALQAAQTGHLVLSSLHTNDSVSAVTRLMDLKVPGFLIASSVSAVLAQRLVRKLCFCRTEAPIRAEYATRMAAAGITDVGDKMYVPAGCAACDNTGYKGRVALYEMLVLNEALRSAIRNGVQDKEICALARNQGMRLLHEDGMSKVRMGLTTIEEISRVVGFAEDTSIRCTTCSKVLPADFRYCSGCGSSVPSGTDRQQMSLTSQMAMQSSPAYVV